MTHLEYERAKFALEHALKQRSRRHVGLAILFCLAWAVVVGAFITSVAVGHWDSGWDGVAIMVLIYGWAIPVSLAKSVIKRPGSKLNHSIDGLQDKVRIYEMPRLRRGSPLRSNLTFITLRYLASDQGAIGLLLPSNNTEPKSKRRVA